MKWNGVKNIGRGGEFFVAPLLRMIVGKQLLMLCVERFRGDVLKLLL